MDPLSPQQMAEVREQAKRQLRQRLSALRLAHPSRALSERSGKIVERLTRLPLFGQARAVALFYPIQRRHEVDLRPLDQAARQRQKRIFYPFMDPKPSGFETGFREVSELSKLADRGRGFLEPAPSAQPAERGDLDLIIAPALAVSASGHRLGYGAGFYDATLPDFCPPARTIVVAFQFQLLAELPVCEHDVACDLVVTDEQVLDVSGVLEI